MTRDVALVTPMAGRGTRFDRAGVAVPKPLIELWGRPLFWWSTESVLRSVDVRELVFVVLDAHVEHFGIDAAIRDVYPTARIVSLPEVTAGAAESAALGVAALETKGPFALNDCDHAFRADQRLHGLLDQILARLHQHLNCDVIRNASFFDQATVELEFRIRRRRKADLDLLESASHQSVEELEFLGNIHRHRQFAVA